jgi:hypothetical protein
MSRSCSKVIHPEVEEAAIHSRWCIKWWSRSGQSKEGERSLEMARLASLADGKKGRDVQRGRMRIVTARTSVTMDFILTACKFEQEIWTSVGTVEI